ncbi:MAG: TMEM175 family protein [Bacteroidota bacterium]|nr:TMEM175 family protein [Bacteroidota bacterium]
MQEPRHDKERQYFQVERATFFVDAVFAITITFLIIEITPPVIKHPTDQLLWDNLTAMGFKFLAFLITFGIVGHYWSVHHRIFGYVIKNSSSLIWLNLGFLLTVVALPFTVALWGEYRVESNLKIPYAIYTANMILTGLMNTWVWRYVSNPKRMMLTRQISRARINLGIYRSLVIPLIFLLSFLVFLLSPIVGYCVLLLIPIILHWGMRGLEKRAERDETAARITPKTATIIKEEIKEEK